MVQLTEDIVGDLDSPDGRDNVVREGRGVLSNIAQTSWHTRQAISSNFSLRGIRTSQEARTAHTLKSEARIQERDDPYHTGKTRREGYFRAERLAVPEHQLVHARKNIEIVPHEPIVLSGVKATDSSTSTEVNTDIEFHHDHLLAGGIKTEEEIFNALRSWSIRHPLLRRAIQFRSGLTFTVEQAREIARQYVAVVQRYQDIAKLYSSNGTSEWNVQAALSIAKQYPDEIIAAVSVDQASAEQALKDANSKLQTFQSIQDLSALTRFDTDKTYDQLKEEFDKIEADIINIATFDTVAASRTSDKAQQMHSDGDRYATHPREVRKALMDEAVKMKAGAQKYKQIGNALERAYANAKAAGLNLAEFDAYIDHSNGKIKAAILNADLDPKIVSDTLTRAFSMSSKEDIVKEITEKNAAYQEASSGKALTGREAILRTYQLYFEKQGMSPEAAREEAGKLYGLNAVGNTEWNVARDTMRRDDVMGQEGRLYQWPKQQLKEILHGSQESYLCHIAESPAIGLQHELSNRFYGPLKFARIFDSTRMLGLGFRKHNARPSWGAMDYHQLLTAYYAIRAAVNNGDLSNTRYVRTNRDEIVRLLLDKFSLNLARDFDADETDAKKIASGAHDQKQLHSEIRKLLAQEAPPFIAPSVNLAVAHARTETAQWRHWAGREIKNATGFGKKTYTSIPARTTLAVVKSPYTAGKWGLGKITGGVKSLWKKANEETSFFS